MKWLLFPFALLYNLITSIRNLLYNTGVFKSRQFDLPVISIGNLKVGGTGKTPHTEYLVRLLMNGKQNLAILSRGYGRQTKGYILASGKDTPQTIGDEPFQYYWKWKEEVKVAVCEKRVEGVEQLLNSNQPPSLILLDDAYQHRAINPGKKILLTEYNKPFYEDHLLPMGRLRESRFGADRADTIIVTKCPASLLPEAAEDVKKLISLYNRKASIYFTCVRYGDLHPLTAWGTSEKTAAVKSFVYSVLLVTGIADGSVLYKDLQLMSYTIIEYKSFPDHKDYTEADISSIIEACKKHNSVLITTEKDAVKLKGHLPNDLPAYYIPIEIDFLWGKDQFNNELITFCRKK
jgi:tetraacyldisaccharide 4'-kinase